MNLRSEDLKKSPRSGHSSCGYYPGLGVIESSYWLVHFRDNAGDKRVSFTFSKRSSRARPPPRALDDLPIASCISARYAARRNGTRLSASCICIAPYKSTLPVSYPCRGTPRLRIPSLCVAADCTAPHFPVREVSSSLQGDACSESAPVIFIDLRTFGRLKARPAELIRRPLARLPRARVAVVLIRI